MRQYCHRISIQQIFAFKKWIPILIFQKTSIGNSLKLSHLLTGILGWRAPRACYKGGMRAPAEELEYRRRTLFMHEHDFPGSNEPRGSWLIPQLPRKRRKVQKVAFFASVFRQEDLPRNPTDMENQADQGPIKCQTTQFSSNCLVSPCIIKPAQLMIRSPFLSCKIDGNKRKEKSIQLHSGSSYCSSFYGFPNT